MRRRLWSAAGVVVVAVAMHDKSGIVHLLRSSIGATVHVLDASAEAAITFLEAGGNATIAATSIFVEALSLSSSVLDDAWQGIDLHGVSATRRIGRLLSANATVALLWLKESGPTQVGNASLRIAESMSALRQPATPFCEFEDTFFDPKGVLVTWAARGRVSASGAVALAFTVTETSFTPSWSNPLWASLDYDITTEAARILQLAGSVAAGLPSSHVDALELVDPSSLFEAAPSSAWHGQIARAVGAAAALLLCIALAMRSDSGQESGGEFAAGAEGSSTPVPTEGNFEMVGESSATTVVQSSANGASAESSGGLGHPI